MARRWSVGPPPAARNMLDHAHGLATARAGRGGWSRSVGMDGLVIRGLRIGVRFGGVGGRWQKLVVQPGQDLAVAVGI